MKADRTYYLISPEVLKDDLIQETFSGNTFGVYSAMTQILSGGTNGSSLLTGLTLPIVFTQTFNDLGYYTPFDGYILQKDVVNNFIYSGGTTDPYQWWESCPTPQSCRESCNAPSQLRSARP